MPVPHLYVRDKGVASSSHRSVASLRAVLAYPVVLVDSKRKRPCVENLLRLARWRIENRRIEIRQRCAFQTWQLDRPLSESPPPARPAFSALGAIARK